MRRKLLSKDRKGLALATVGALAIVAVGAGAAAGATDGGEPLGQAPPEWAANAGAWPAHDYDLNNTRDTTQSPINSGNVSSLKVKWRFKFSGTGAYGIFASNPIVLNGTVYLQDLNSNVVALDRNTGAVRWRHRFASQSIGPNGLSYGYGHLYGATVTKAFALDPATGNLLWSRSLPRNGKEGIDMTPQLYDGKVLVSTIPGRGISNFYRGGALGQVFALDAQTGAVQWKFNTISDGAKLWGNPKVNSGGGLWYPPSVDSQGRVFLSVANPAPYPGTPKFPNGSSRPGPDLYTDSIVALDGQTGKMLWHRQAVPHDIRDYDLMIPTILATVPVGGVPTEVAMVAGKMGKVYAYRAADGKHLWTRSVGKHQNDVGPLTRKFVKVFPGEYGGVETPMASASGRLFVPWLDLPVSYASTGISTTAAINFNAGRGGLTAIDEASGKVLWQRRLSALPTGAATVANDVVFAPTYSGQINAFDTATGRTLWSTKARAGINGFPAVDGDQLLVGAGTTGAFKNPHFELTAYALSQ